MIIAVLLLFHCSSIVFLLFAYCLVVVVTHGVSLCVYCILIVLSMRVRRFVGDGSPGTQIRYFSELERVPSCLGVRTSALALERNPKRSSLKLLSELLSVRTSSYVFEPWMLERGAIHTDTGLVGVRPGCGVYLSCVFLG